jgi:hypothetical protein
MVNNPAYPIAYAPLPSVQSTAIITSDAFDGVNLFALGKV